MKEFLSREGISYQEKNVAIDQRAAQEMVSRSGQMGVPVTILADQVIVGFDQPALKKAVARLRQQKPNNSGSPNNTIKLGAQVADAAKVLTQTARPGALLGAIKPDSLAAKAGLHEGDIIVSLNDQPINNADDLAKVLQMVATQKLSRPTLIFWRNGQQLDTKLPLQF